MDYLPRSETVRLLIVYVGYTILFLYYIMQLTDSPLSPFSPFCPGYPCKLNYIFVYIYYMYIDI